jgi:ribonucleotide reductase alpha subunit
MYMRIAVSLYLDSDAGSCDFDAIKATYDALSLGQYSHASPTMFNAGSHYQQLSSCYLLGIADSMEEDGGIPDCWKACAKISKRAGGIGVGIPNIRCRGSLIAGTGGQSDGIVPLARVFNDIAVYVNQGGRRPGAIALYIEPWHPDVISFLNLRKQHGLEEERARALFTGLWIPDLFMKRLSEALTSKMNALGLLKHSEINLNNYIVVMKQNIDIDHR